MQSKLKFFVVGRRRGPPSDAQYPYVVLEKDGWNDYGFNTLFHPKIYADSTQIVDLRDVKIMQRGQNSTELEEKFEDLDNTYCSLGQELAYYESLLELPEEIWQNYLTALNDAAANPAIREKFESEKCFRVSLLRWGPAEGALEDASAILQRNDEEEESDNKLSFIFRTKFGANDVNTNFHYCEVDELPGRINAVIGYNGTGKTQLLANLAMVASADSEKRINNEPIDGYGEIDLVARRFSKVVAISYSAFDTFRVPSNPGKGDDVAYAYCGLRRISGDNKADGLKDVGEIVEEIATAISRVDTQRRRSSLEQALQPLRDEPSFGAAGYKIDILGDKDQWYKEFHSFSTGHKISVNIIVQLVGSLQQGSLVLIDEPESHLHPPLLAAMMKGIGIALKAHNSYAVIATHSPVVLQEIPSQYAHVLRREGSLNYVENPSIETFGENIGLLTRHVFNLDNSQSDYVGTLRSLPSDLSLEQIEKLFRLGLSSQAHALILQMKRG